MNSGTGSVANLVCVCGANEYVGGSGKYIAESVDCVRT